MSCAKCGGEHQLWWDCPVFDGKAESFHKHSNYGWKFGQFCNDSRRESFHKKMAAEPFSGISRD